MILKQISKGDNHYLKKQQTMSHVDALIQRAENVVLKDIFNIK
jgi:hypothetical protein